MEQHVTFRRVAGMLVGIETAARLLNLPSVDFPQETAIGALSQYISDTSIGNFQPMNVNFGIIKELDGPRIRDKKERYEKIAERALQAIENYQNL